MTAIGSLSFVVRGLDIMGSENFGSVPDAVSPALETEPRMPMRDVTEHKMETERARHGLLSTLHADIETSCRMGGLHISGVKRVSSDGTLLTERQAFWRHGRNRGK